MQYTFRPLGPWTEGDTEDRRSKWTFKASWTDTQLILRRELAHLDAANVVVQADFREQDLRRDGMPRSGAREPTHPGVRVAFESKHGPLTYATDSCAFWQHNVRSIALGLEALRAVDRYGITRRAEQYRGWAQLGPGTGAAPSGMTADAASELVQKWAGFPIHKLNQSEHASLFRRARANAHPDRLGGDSAAFLLLEHAGRVLGLIA